MSVTEKRLFFIIGGPGSGRSTQCRRMAHMCDWAHISVSEILIDEVNM
jgi:adenylate kinase family enzyme